MISKPETLEEFYREKLSQQPALQKEIGHFNVFDLEICLKAQPVLYSRKDFYKITLIRGKSRYHYADKSIELSGTTLIFFNPQVPYTWEPLSDDTTGYFCIFSRSFFSRSITGNFNDLPMYQPGGRPAYQLSEKEDAQVAGVFIKMMEEVESDYIFKHDLLKNYVTELTHFALKSKPSESLYQHPDAKARITSIFNELLERQFPIESPSQRFSMRSASDFADQLAVHVNYLNRAIKETTGKTTTDLIAERLLAEAKVLLKYTSWNISEIGYSLGFEAPSHFNNFFKKQTQFTPSAFRSV